MIAEGVAQVPEVSKNEAAGNSSDGRSDGKEDVRRVIGVVHENACGDERGGESSDAPTEVEEREEGRAARRDMLGQRRA